MPEHYDDITNDDLIDLLVDRTSLIDRPGNAPKRMLSGLEVRSGSGKDIPVTQPSSPQRHPDGDDLLGTDQRYRPLASVWYGEEDADLIEDLLRFYPHREPRLILVRLSTGVASGDGANGL